MTEAGWTVCIECGMMCEAVEYHPYAACLMFKQCLNSETVRANLQAVRDDSYQQGRVAALGEVERYMAMRLRLAEASLATEILSGNEVKQGRERAAIAELHGMQRHVSDIKEQLAQQAQDEKGVGDGN